MATPAKKFINNPEHVVEEMVQGLLATGRGLARVGKQHVLVRADYKSINQSQVVIISGGGSGHEPAHAGFVGDGMISGAVLGGVFASPGANAVESAIRAIAGPPGCLLVVKNYTGDRLNFGIAMEKAKAAGIPCEMVVVTDDCALPKDKGITGRRGVAGTVFVHKVAGAAAAAGKSLAEVTAAAKKAIAATGSMGVALGTCTLPGQPKNERLDDKTIEIGLGIHGEPGAKQSPLLDCNTLVDTAVSSILDPAVGDTEPYLPTSKGTEVAVLINSLGSASPMELALIGRRAISNVEGRGLKVSRCISGALLTSLDMAGFSLSLMTLDAELKAALDLPVKAPSWTGLEDTSVPVPAEVPEPVLEATAPAAAGGGCEQEVLGKRIKAAAEAIIAAEPQLTAWDEICGDGDCGITMKRGAVRVLEDLPKYPKEPASCLAAVADSVNNSMGGSSGALLQLFFRAAGTALGNGKSDAEAFQAGVDAVMFYGNGKKGFRTMLDAMIPAADAWKAGGDLPAVAGAAKGGAEETKTMSANAGRANYVNEDAYRGTPDPGAMAVACALEAMAAVK